MKITCPKCGDSFEWGETRDIEACPICGTSLEVAHAENGFMLIGAGETVKPLKAARDPAISDPVAEDYAQWRTRAVFCILFGVVLAAIMGMAIAHGLSGFGAYYFKDLKNKIFISLLGLGSAFFIGGGAWLYRYLKKAEDGLRLKTEGSPPSCPSPIEGEGAAGKSAEP